jgi:hypothetical protein
MKKKFGIKFAVNMIAFLANFISRMFTDIIFIRPKFN